MDDATKQPISTGNEVKQTLMFICMYLVLIAISSLLFVYINIYFNDNQTEYLIFNHTFYSESIIRLFLSVLIVSYPLFAILFLLTKKQFTVNPHLRLSKLRIYFIYITLVGSAMAIIGDCIYFILALLYGHFSLVYDLNFFTILIIFGIPFAYFFNEIKQNHKLYG